MALDYRIPSDMEEIQHVLSSCVRWYTRLSEFLFYGAQGEVFEVQEEHFSQWLENKRDASEQKIEPLERVSGLCRQMKAHATALIHYRTAHQMPPQREAFKNLTIEFEELLYLLMRFKQDEAIKSSGVDIDSGLRSPDVMMDDLEKELYRFERQGREFSVALVVIRGFEALDADEETQLLAVKVLSEIIRQELRIYDDAYYMGKGEFWLSLKQTDTAGALLVLSRIEKMFRNSDVCLRLGERNPDIAILLTAAEPLPSWPVEEMQRDMRSQLMQVGTEQATRILNYADRSPMERFLAENYDSAQ